MKKILGAAIAVASLALAISCTTFVPVATDGTVGSKRGESTGATILGIIHTGNGSIIDAAETSGIKHVSTVDMKVTNYLGLYVKRTTIISGD